MKVGDWVLTDGEVGQITLIDYINGGGRWHLVRVDSQSFPSMRSESGMSRIEKPVADILNAVNTNEENQNGII